MVDGRRAVSMQRFRDRAEAGQQLAARLRSYARRADALVLGLPRGGVPVAYEVARSLEIPLDIIVVRKLGTPLEPELAMGAIALGGVIALNDDVIHDWRIPREAVDAVIARERRELVRREWRYRGDRPHADLRGRTVILVDDGIATGATVRAAIAALRQKHPARIIVAAPVAAAATCAQLRREADEVVCAQEPDDLYGIGLWYEQFPQVSDETVCALLAQAWGISTTPADEPPSTRDQRDGVDATR